MAFRRYGDPRLRITLWAASNLPDCVTVASSPAKTTSFLGLSNLEMSPISLMMAAPVTLPIPNGSNGGFQLFHDAGDFNFRFFYLFFNKGNLFNQRFELKGKAAFGKSNTKGTGCGSL